MFYWVTIALNYIYMSYVRHKTGNIISTYVSGIYLNVQLMKTRWAFFYPT
jgi:hypothetical protein